MNDVTDPGNLVTTDPDAAFALLSKRWDEFSRWIDKHADRVPEVASERVAWEAFRADRAGSSFRTWAPGLDPHNDAIQGQLHDLAVAESNAHAHGYVVPKLKIDGSPASFFGPASYTVSRVDAGQPTGAESPGPTSPAEAGKKHDATIVNAPVAPSNETLHPIATVIDKEAPKPPTPENIAPKVVALGAVALGTIAGAIAVKGDGAKAGVAAGGTLLAVLLGYVLFSPSAPAKEKVADPKMAGVPATQRRHAHTCHNCGNVWWHDPGPCQSGTGSPAACTIAHVCENCGHIERHVDTSICGTEEP